MQIDEQVHCCSLEILYKTVDRRGSVRLRIWDVPNSESRKNLPENAVKNDATQLAFVVTSLTYPSHQVEAIGHEPCDRNLCGDTPELVETELSRYVVQRHTVCVSNGISFTYVQHNNFTLHTLRWD